MPAPHRNSPFKLTLASTALLIALTACTTGPTGPTGPQFEPVTHWWETTPSVQVNEYSSIEIELTFRNLTDANVEFLGDTGINNPADELQVWTTPDAADPPVAFDEFPVGEYAPNASMTWRLSIDLSRLGNAAQGIAIRPVSQSHGTMGPTRLELTESTVTWVR